ncbi:MAG: carboxylesterase [Candidatus Sumerlaeota bacterium]|nr:carboxylesterase [Candidatus Sumerlaeota bacterium]
MLQLLLLLAAALLAVLLTHNAAMALLVRHEVKHTARDPETGILLGAEERTLGPEDADAAVLFVHGHVGAGSNFGDFPDRLAEQGFRVRVMRLPGHGTTPMEYAKTTNAQLLDAVRAEAAALRAQHGRVLLVAHSMGATLSTLVAAEGGADAVVLVAPYYGVTHRAYYVLPPETWARLTAPVVPWVYKGELFLQLNRREAVGEVLSYRIVPTSSLVRMQELAAQARTPEALARIECPVLWIHSTGDVAASYTVAGETTGLMTNASVEHLRLEKANHHIFFDYERDKATAAVEEFAERLHTAPLVHGP